jgi:hypothetical protein
VKKGLKGADKCDRKTQEHQRRKEKPSSVLTRLLEEAREAQKKKRQDGKDSLLTSSLAEKNKEDELLVRGPAQNAPLVEFDRSLTKEESINLFAEVKDANPDAAPMELGQALRVAKLKAALVWRRMKMRDEKDSSSLPLPLSHLGTVRLTCRTPVA